MDYDSTKDTVEHIGKVQQRLFSIIVNLMGRAFTHDASKLESPEKEMYDEFTPQLQKFEYGTPEYYDIKGKMGLALDHHYQVNSHHPEHFHSGINDMSLLDVVEMLADWKAASERMKSGTGDLRKSIEHNAERFEMGEQLKQIMLNTAGELGWI